MKKVWERDDMQKWVRMPVSGVKEPHTGLSRAYMYQLIKEEKVKSACLRQPGAEKGVRLIWLPSLLQHIETCIDIDPHTAD